MRKLLLVPAIFALILLNYGWANMDPIAAQVNIKSQSTLKNGSISVFINSPKYIHGIVSTKALTRALDMAQRKLNNSLIEAQKSLLETAVDVSPQPALISGPIGVNLNPPKHIQGTSCEKVLARALGRAQNKLNNSLTEAQKRFLETTFPE